MWNFHLILLDTEEKSSFISQNWNKTVALIKEQCTNNSLPFLQHLLKSVLIPNIICFLQTGMLSIVEPPDFDSEATSSDVMVGEGNQVNIFFFISHCKLSKEMFNNYNCDRLIKKKASIIFHIAVFKCDVNFESNVARDRQLTFKGFGGRVGNKFANKYARRKDAPRRAWLDRRSLNNLPRAEPVMNKRRFITYKCGLIYARSKLSGQRYSTWFMSAKSISENRDARRLRGWARK